jgi:hypothetical protein
MSSNAAASVAREATKHAGGVKTTVVQVGDRSTKL